MGSAFAAELFVAFMSEAEQRELVLFSLVNPHLVCHFRHPECEREVPHLDTECGRLTREDGAREVNMASERNKLEPIDVWEEAATIAEQMALNPWGAAHDAITPGHLAQQIAAAIRECGKQSGAFTVYRCEDWQCRYVFDDHACCIQPRGHTGDHQRAFCVCCHPEKKGKHSATECIILAQSSEEHDGE